MTFQNNHFTGGGDPLIWILWLTRRLTLSTNFAVRLYKMDHCSLFFTHAKQNSSRRDVNRLFVEYMARTKNVTMLHIITWQDWRI